MPELAATRSTPRGPIAWVGQILLYGAFAAFIVVFSNWPEYRHLAADEAVIKISFIHTGQPVSDCVRQTAEELAKLPPNMRRPTRCPRERSPIVVAVDIDDVNVLTDSAEPSGLSKDGASAVFRRLVVPAGERHISVRLSDDVRARDTPYERDEVLALAPGQILVIDFDASQGGITFK
ncbi:MAG: hypothetical protein WCZ28_06665 [Burkholderiaceae bacterium]